MCAISGEPLWRRWFKPNGERSGTAPPAAAYHFSPDRKGEHPQKHLGASKGILQGEEGQQTVRWTVCPTNAYAGFRDLYLAEGNGEARFGGEEDQRAFQWKDRPTNACWADLRNVRDRLDPVAAGRSLFDVEKETGSEIAREALERIGLRHGS